MAGVPARGGVDLDITETFLIWSAMSSDDAPDRSADGPDEVGGTAPAADQVSGGSATGGGSGGFFTSRNMFLLALAVSIGAFVVAAVFGVLWWTAAAGDESETAATRDEVIVASSEAIRAFTEFDEQNPDAFRESQLAIANEDMKAQIEQSWPKLREAIVKGKRSATTTIFDIAVEELNVHEGKASVIAALEVQVKGGKETAKKRIRIQTQMERVEDSWKLAGIDQVPVEPGS